MKKILLSLTLCLGLSACGGSDNNNLPAEYVGLWAERIDLEAVDSIGANSINNGECSLFTEDSNFPQIDATIIEPSGAIYGITGNELGSVKDREPTAFMSQDGVVNLELDEEARQLGFEAQVRFELISPDVALGTTTILQQGSLSSRDVTELVRISETEFEIMVDRVVTFCSPIQNRGN